MMQFAYTDAKHPYIISLSRDILRRDAKEGNKHSEVEALFNWFKKNIRYTKDVYKVETLVSPVNLLSVFKQGDCDCLVTCFTAMLLSIGFPVQFIIIKLQPEGAWKHVYLRVNINGKWVPVDLTNKQGYVGWEYPGACEKRIYNVGRHNLIAVEIDGELDSIIPSWEDIEDWASKIRGWATATEEFAERAPHAKEYYDLGLRVAKMKEALVRWAKNPLTWALGFGMVITTTIVLKKRREK